ncbi:hypothetical protein STRIP9103_03138 [Streptomyces ipomoeae 91-03]|uniref:Uncharacterized protein n=1 Tax=Streptomyces ipomoeae 91-03 TaxID=698759 RepID=L1KJ62_9ACTN|nr:hypothetical protein STRIP9103_03138 [Streptomyces ipomoeae 91-03]
MKSRAVSIVSLVLFLIPVVLGLADLVRAVAVPGAPECPGIALDEVGEEHPGPMRPGFTCHLYDDWTTMRPTGTRTFEQQKNAQDAERDDHYARALGYIAYGIAGLVVVAAARGTRPALPSWWRGNRPSS